MGHSLDLSPGSSITGHPPAFPQLEKSARNRECIAQRLQALTSQQISLAPGKCSQLLLVADIVKDAPEEPGLKSKD